jgi:hypothetical protein
LRTRSNEIPTLIRLRRPDPRRRFAGTLVVIPEPCTALLGGLGVLALLRRRRNA